jgi:HlyD family secretion protein
MIYKRKLPLFVLIVSVMFITSSCGILLEDGGKSSVGLQASGVVEATQIYLASELGGRVTDVFVEDGDQVSTGDPLFQIEDKLLQAQLRQAEAAYSVAQANYALVAAGMTKEQKSASISAAELELAAATHDLYSLYKNTDLIAAQNLQQADQLEHTLNDLENSDLTQALALKAIADAKKAIENAERRLNSVKSSADEADISAAHAQVVLAKDALDDAKDDFEPYENKPEDNLQRANYQAKLAAAQQTYDAAVRKYNALVGTGSEADIAVAEADLRAAQAQLSDAEREWERVKDGPQESDLTLLKAQISQAQQDYEIYKNGPDPDDVSLAQARLANAESQLSLAKADFPTQEELDVAQAQIDSAEANLDAIQTQVDLLSIKSPADGVVITRNIEPGEVIQPGLAAMTIAVLDKLTITVYIPEDQYGQISIGDEAVLSVDSFPGETFNAVVVRIADKAEYTPRNVQTKEDRQTTVYAIELSVVDPQGKLKPGMPTDVEFLK